MAKTPRGVGFCRRTSYFVLEHQPDECNQLPPNGKVGTAAAAPLHLPCT